MRLPNSESRTSNQAAAAKLRTIIVTLNSWYIFLYTDVRKFI